MKGYQVSKIINALCYCKLLANSLTMITHVVQMSINKIMMLLCQNMQQNIDKQQILKQQQIGSN